MAKSKDILIASSATKAGLRKLVNAYFYSEKSLQDGGVIANTTRTGVVTSYCWREERGRFRLYRLAPKP